MDPSGSLAHPALHRVLAEHVPENWLSGERLRRWALIAHIAAILGPDLSSTREKLGKSLSDCDLKEGRLIALLQARGDQLLVLAPRIARLAATKGVALNITELGQYLLDEARDDERAESRRVRIAQAFYRTEHQRNSSKAA
jgi:CRISPR system Cascade subunit CasB